MTGKSNIFVLRQLHIKLVLLVFADAKTIAAEITAARDSCAEGMLIEIVGIEDVELGMYAFRRMCSQFQFAVNHIL